MTMPFETYFDPFSGTMIEDIGDDDVFVAERDVKIPEGMLAKLINILHSGQNDFGNVAPTSFNPFTITEIKLQFATIRNSLRSSLI